MKFHIDENGQPVYEHNGQVFYPILAPSGNFGLRVTTEGHLVLLDDEDNEMDATALLTQLSAAPPDTGGAASVPTVIADGTVFTIPTGAQVSYCLPISIEGSGVLDVEGDLIETKEGGS